MRSKISSTAPASMWSKRKRRSGTRSAMDQIHPSGKSCARKSRHHPTSKERPAPPPV
jgi:hypothetical protein